MTITWEDEEGIDGNAQFWRSAVENSSFEPISLERTNTIGEGALYTVVELHICMYISINHFQTIIILMIHLEAWKLCAL